MVDPERWVPEGFVVIQVDSRGTGRSEGYLDPFGPVETRDFYEWIEWAGTQPWSNGKVGLIGVSYLAIKQWQVARQHQFATPVPYTTTTAAQQIQAVYRGNKARAGYGVPPIPASTVVSPEQAALRRQWWWCCVLWPTTRGFNNGTGSNDKQNNNGY